MGSYRIQDVKLVNILDEAEKDLQQMKGTQYVGRTVLATKVSSYNKLVESKDVKDPTNPSVTIYSVIDGTITFTAESQINPYGRLIIDFYDLSGNKIVNNGVIGQTGQTPSNYNIVVTQVGDGKLAWTIQINGPSTPHFLAKFSVAATDRGTVIFTSN